MSVNDFMFSTARRIFVDSFPSPEIFCFARVRLNPFGSHILYHNLGIDDGVENHILRCELCDRLLSNHHFSQLEVQILKIFLVKLSLPNWWSLNWTLAKNGDILSSRQKKILVLQKRLS